ncbi:hypothetical protein J0H58_04880 [bacterium]|nr:hypothetical protein [bacterium]
MAKSVRCPCHGNPACKLCAGTKFYEYQPSDRGWLPFRCPTCADAKSAQERQACVTCHGAVGIDPANPPYDPGWMGQARVGWKFLFGGG